MTTWLQWRRGSERVPTREVTVFRPRRDGWSFGFAVEYEGHPGEVELRLTLGPLLVVFWSYRKRWQGEHPATTDCNVRLVRLEDGLEVEGLVSKVGWS